MGVVFARKSRHRQLFGREKYWRDALQAGKATRLSRERNVMILWIYRLLFGPVLLVGAPFYLWRMRRRGGYGRHFGDRFGGFDRVPAKVAGAKRIWIQAVSVGELLAIGPLLDAFKADPHVEIVLTTTTSTGFALAERRYGSCTVAIGYFPLDARPFSRRTWRSLAPDLVVMVEGEWWPEHFAQARARSVPVVCINARLSDRSFRRMRWLGFALKPLFGGIAMILTGSDLDRLRFLALGFVREDRLKTTGNLKLDVAIAELEAGEVRALRASLGFPEDGKVLLGSSTWPGEELAMISAFRAVRERDRTWRLLLVPRHAERRQEIVPLLAESGFTFHVRSTGSAPGSVDIVLADTTGELRKLTQLAELVFVGKSLRPHHEGQTPIEAAALSKPLLFGPGMSNFRSIAQELVQSRAAMVVEDAEALKIAILQLAHEPAEREVMATAAAEWHRHNRGALDRTVAALHQMLA